jgi:hypothetical protein
MARRISIEENLLHYKIIIDADEIIDVNPHFLGGRLGTRLGLVVEIWLRRLSHLGGV